MRSGSFEPIPAGGGSGTGAEPTTRASGARPFAQHPGLLHPTASGTVGAPERQHPRPDYLIEDGDVFADDRWFTPPVIGAGAPEGHRG